MRIGHIVLTPRYSGAEILVASLSKIHAQMGHDIKVAGINPAHDDFVEIIRSQTLLGIEWCCPRRELTRIGRINYLKNWASNYDFDFIFAHSVIPAAYGRLAGLNNVISVLHDSSENDYSNSLLFCFEKVLQFRSLGVVAVSKLALDRYSTHFLRPKTRLIKNGIDLDLHRGINLDQALELKKSLNLKEGDLIVLQVGRVNRVKQQHKSLEALEKAIKRNNRIHFLIAGLIEDQEYYSGMKNWSKEKGILENIIFLGGRADVDKLLSISDLFLMPSLEESQGIALLEALASGTPVIASKLQIFEFAEKYGGVSLLNLEDVDLFSAQAEKYLYSGSKYKRNLDEFDINTTAKNYLEFALECIS